MNDTIYVCFDKSNGHKGGRRYLWWFNTKKEAQDQYKLHKGNPLFAPLYAPKRMSRAYDRWFLSSDKEYLPSTNGTILIFRWKADDPYAMWFDNPHDIDRIDKTSKCLKSLYILGK
jgi:hypothetical protein